MGGFKEFMDELESKKGGEKPGNDEAGMDERTEPEEEGEDKDKDEKFGDFFKKNQKRSGFAIFITSLGR